MTAEKIRRRAAALITATLRSPRHAATPSSVKRPSGTILAYLSLAAQAGDERSHRRVRNAVISAFGAARSWPKTAVLLDVSRTTLSKIRERVGLT